MPLKQPMQIIFVSDHGTQPEALEHLIQNQGQVSWSVVTTLEASIQELQQREVDAVVCARPGVALAILKESGRKLPVMVLHGDTEVDAILLDNFLANLPPRWDPDFPHAAVLAAFEENTSDGLFLVNREGSITYANRSAERLSGIRKAELEHSPIKSLWAPSVAEALSQTLAKVFEKGHSIHNVEGFIRHHKGRNIPVLLSASAVQDDERISGVVVTLKNNSELRRASADITLLHKQMDVERSHFETIMQQFPAGIVIAEAPSGRIVFFNDQAQALLGSDAVAASCIEDYGQIQAFTPDGKVVQADDWPLSHALKSGVSVPGGVIRMFQSETNSDRFLSLNAAPILNSDGEVTSAVMAIFDITAEREAQQSIVQAKEEAERANQAKTAFLANISHEIRTPLGAVIGFTSLMRSGDIPPEERDETLAIIERNGQDLLRLIDEILDLSKVEAQRIDVKKVECSISAIIRDVMNLLGYRAREKGLNIEVTTDRESPDIITTDPARLKQILVNIVGNAVKFTEKGRIQIEIVAAGPITPSSAPLLFRVKDSGIGIDSDHIGQLFQPFSQIDCTNTRRFGGTGLGLLLSRKLARLLGGDVILEQSAPGVGSTFVVTIDGAPARKRIQAQDREVTAAYPAAGKAIFARTQLESISILAADDSMDNQLLLKSFLTRYGAKVDFASNGFEAVEKAAANPYDIVLMDLQMPVCDGYSATRRLRSMGFDKPILALSAHARNEEQEKSFLAGCNDHITKPINIKSLLASIVRHTGLETESQSGSDGGSGAWEK
ncbi:MAG TPA: response regulator [Oligoflexus sp.]|uniref:response regulator n=1 Tax=Oligoflexus sp. TaxID=1971216 RepID=UPI002D7F8770|nr:response regulator [Oligoflexus sp.]HET9239691.1 response regulator [Oligoflexus sp.]